MSHINVYIDGACSDNGKGNAKAGYGVFFGENDNRNENGLVIGKQSNNTGELTAFIRCIEILKEDIKSNKKINIYTDSEYVIKCVSTYGDKLAQNNWILKKDKIIPNLELVKKAYILYKNIPNIKIHYVKAHTDNYDIHSIGNREADRLACLAVGKIRQNNTQNNIIKLDWVSFDNKDYVKNLGAKWNNSNKFWYIPENTPPEVIKQIMECKNMKPINEKIYIKVAYAKKDVAKSLGARWDANMKSWYYIDKEIGEEQKLKLKNL